MKDWFIDWHSHKDWFESLKKLIEFLDSNGFTYDEKFQFVFLNGEKVGRIERIE